ncbi:hypothetical protein D3C71_1594110 [compost metagenome]
MLVLEITTEAGWVYTAFFFMDVMGNVFQHDPIWEIHNCSDLSIETVLEVNAFNPFDILRTNITHRRS